MKRESRLLGGIVASLFLFGSALAQPDTLWTKTYGGAGSDYGWSVQQTTDNGYIVAGITNSFGVGSYDVYLIKTDENSDTLWTKTHGGTDWDEGWSVQQTGETGYIVVGWTNSFGAGDYDVYLIKTDANGDTLWTRTYGGTYRDEGRSVQQTTDNGYIIAGNTDPLGTYSFDVYLIKTDANGDTLWTRTYGGTEDDGSRSVQQTPDNGYVIAGWTSSFAIGGSDVWLLRTDANGDTLWTRTYGGTDWDEARSMQQTTDNGYIIAGVTASFGAGGSDIYLIKTDANGDTLWTRTYGGTGDEYGNSVQQTIDNGYIIVGYTQSFGPGWFNLYVVKTDANGDTLWTQVYGGTELDFGYSVQQTTDNGYIVAGQTGSFGAGQDDVWLIKTKPDVGVEEDEMAIAKHSDFVATIICGPLQLPEGEKYRVFDIIGRAVVPGKMRPGIYFLEIDGEIVQKVIKVR